MLRAEAQVPKVKKATACQGHCGGVPTNQPVRLADGRLLCVRCCIESYDTVDFGHAK